MHFINLNWELLSRFLCYKQISGSHTGAAIRSSFDAVMDERSIPKETLGYIMGDNAKNICKAFNMEDIVMDEWTVNARLFPDLGVRLSDPDEAATSAAGTEEETSEVDSDLETDNEDSSDEDISLSPEEDDLAGAFLDDIIRLRCLAHTLQLAINDAIKDDEEVSAIVKYLNSIIQTFRKSPLRSDHLMKFISKQLIPIGKTRWNSILFAAERLLEVI